MAIFGVLATPQTLSNFWFCGTVYRVDGCTLVNRGVYT